MNALLAVLVSPVTTYLELTVSAPCHDLLEARKSRKISPKKIAKFSLFGLLRKQRKLSSPDHEAPTTYLHVDSVTDHYYRHWH